MNDETRSLPADGQSKMAKWLRFGAGLALGLIFLALVRNSVDLASVGRMMAHAAWPPLVLALIWLVALVKLSWARAIPGAISTASAPSVRFFLMERLEGVVNGLVPLAVVAR